MKDKGVDDIINYNDDILDVKKFKLLPGNILFVPHTGKIIKVSPLARKVLNSIQNDSNPETFSDREYSIITTLKKLLLENAIIRKRKNKILSEFRSISLMVTQCCNLDCIYCYGNQGTYGENEIKFMSFETAIRAIDWFLKTRKESKLKENKLGFNFFGGEPLLAFPIIKKVVSYIIEKSKQNDFVPLFSITTNGTLFNKEIVEFFNDNNFSMVVSIDGPPEIHNRNRPLKNGGDSYSTIREGLEIIQRYKNLKDKTTLRATYIPGNGNLKDVITHLKGIGFRKVQVEFVSWEKNRDIPYSSWYKIIEKDMEPIFLEMEKSFKRSEWPEKFIPDVFKSYLNILYKRELKEYFCGVGHTFVEISTKGDIYPCQRFVGNKEWKIGNINNGFLKIKKLKDLSRLNVNISPICNTCWLRYICGGGCSYNNWFINGKVDHPDPLHCAYMNVLFDNLIPLYARYKDFIIPFMERGNFERNGKKSDRLMDLQSGKDIKVAKNRWRRREERKKKGGKHGKHT